MAEAASTIRLERTGPVYVLALESGENRFSAAVIKGISEALDEVERTPPPVALVTTGAGKFYSNGLDLDHMIAQGSDGAKQYLAQVLGILGRVLSFPTPTVAAVNGHAFGAGAQLAIAHDFQVMRSDRGFFCMPEIDMKVALHPGMVALLCARMPARTVHRVIATGKRFGGEEARAEGIVDRAVPEGEVLPTAIAIAGELAGKADPVMSTLKRGMYAHVLEALSRPLELP